MELTVTEEHPIAKALRGAGALHQETWLVLKTLGGPTHLRALVNSWNAEGGVVHVKFETWESYLERKAQLSGI